MRNYRSNTKYSLDGGVLIALALGEKFTEKLKESILRGEVEVFTSQIALIEMMYILCRKAGWKIAENKKSSLLFSRMIQVVPLEELLDEVTKIKCERRISLADCCTIALARIYNCKALFVKKERELEEEMKRKPFDIEIEFLTE